MMQGECELALHRPDMEPPAACERAEPDDCEAKEELKPFVLHPLGSDPQPGQGEQVCTPASRWLRFTRVLCMAIMMSACLYLLERGYLREGSSSGGPMTLGVSIRETIRQAASTGLLAPHLVEQAMMPPLPSSNLSLMVDVEPTYETGEGPRDWLVARFSGEALHFTDYIGYETRHESIMWLFQRAWARVRHVLPANTTSTMCIFSGDRKDPLSECPAGEHDALFTTSQTARRAHLAFPCFVFHRWREAFIGDFEATVAAIRDRAGEQPEDPRLFWAGSLATNHRREKLAQLAQEHPDTIRCLDVHVSGSHDDYLSLPDHARYAMLIDLEGNGYSGRLKLLAHHGRPLFVQDRSNWDWAASQMQPGIHYVPVARDLSDLMSRIEEVRANETAAAAMVKARMDFAAKHLTREAALRQIVRLILLSAYGSQTLPLIGG